MKVNFEIEEVQGFEFLFTKYLTISLCIGRFRKSVKESIIELIIDISGIFMIYWVKNSWVLISAMSMIFFEKKI